MTTTQTAPEADMRVAMSPGVVSRHWGSFTTLSPLTQTYPGGERESGHDKEKTVVTLTRKWNLGGDAIPVVSGDSFRGLMRRVLADHLTDSLGLTPGSLPMSVAHLLHVGGALGKGEAKTITNTQIAAARRLLPSLALLGGTFLNGWMAGRLRMGNWVAQTEDTPEVLMAPGASDEGLPLASACVIEETHARSAFSAEGYDQSWFTNGEPRIKVKDDPLNPMPHAREIVVPGVTFAGWVALGTYRGLSADDDALHRSCLAWALDRCYPDGLEVTIGLRAAQGQGVVSFAWGDTLEVLSDETVPGERYKEHLAARGDEIAELLHGLVPVKAKKVDEPKKDKRSANGAAAVADADTDDGASADVEDNE